MNHVTSCNRREFLRSAAAGVAGVGLLGPAFAQEAAVAWPREALTPAPPEQAGVDPQKLQEAVDFVANEFGAGTIPGAALVATRGGRKFVERYWGTCAGRDRADAPFDGSVLSMMFSFSKAVTATVAVMAHQEGLFDYDDPAHKHIKGFTGGGKEAITVRHLLTHAAGLTAAPLDPVLSEEEWKTAIAKLCAMDTEWEPGSRTGYHGISGMLLVAEVVRQVSGNRPWNDICRERLFEPLGAGITFDVPPVDAPVALVPPPKSYPAMLDTENIPFLGHPSGGAFARPDDMLKLLNLHLGNGKWNGRTLLQPEALKEMHRVQYQKEIDAAIAAGKGPKHEFWGLGWLLRGTAEESWFGFGNVASARTFGHAGIDTVIGLADPETDTALVFLSTASPGEAKTTMRLRNTVTNKVMAAVRG